MCVYIRVIFWTFVTKHILLDLSAWRAIHEARRYLTVSWLFFAAIHLWYRLIMCPTLYSLTFRSKEIKENPCWSCDAFRGHKKASVFIGSVHLDHMAGFDITASGDLKLEHCLLLITWKMLFKSKAPLKSFFYLLPPCCVCPLWVCGPRYGQNGQKKGFKMTSDTGFATVCHILWETTYSVWDYSLQDCQLENFCWSEIPCGQTDFSSW